MSIRIIALFNLKPGQSRADYEAWARAHDLPTVRALPSVQQFDVFRCTGLLGAAAGAPAESPYAYIEIIDIADMDQFGRDIASEEMQRIAEAFSAIADVTFITTEKLQ